MNCEVTLLWTLWCPGHMSSQRRRAGVVAFDACSHSIHKNIILIPVGRLLEVDPQEPQIDEQRSSDQFPSLSTLQICFQILIKSGVIMQCT